MTPGKTFRAKRSALGGCSASSGGAGLATVYEAQRDDGQFSQRAAFKVMRRGLDTDDLIARFRVEREILATLEHPSIAGILDGGAMPDGRPYLVMEYVDGVSITEYVRSHELGTRERIRLVRDIAEALHHAHQRLFVHRDVKPSQRHGDQRRRGPSARLRHRQDSRSVRVAGWRHA